MIDLPVGRCTVAAHRVAQGRAVARHRLGAALLCVASALSGCAPHTPPAPVPAAAECIVLDDVARPRITVAVAPAGTDPRAAAADRITGMTAAQLHETLVRVSCDGSVVPALATSWSSNDSLRWRFTVAAGHRFTDGTPVDAQSIVAAWSSARTPLLADVTAVGDDVIDVTLRDPADVRVFSLPQLAVVRPAQTGSWPHGTGSFAVHSAVPGRSIRLVARHDSSAAAARTGTMPDTIDIRVFPGDMRVAIDAGADVLIASDAATFAYADARSDYAFAPLPWNRTWVLLTSTDVSVNDVPGAARSGAPNDNVGADTSHIASEFTSGLLGVPTRAPAPPYWWQQCAAPQVESSARSDRRVLYARDDATARAIAERIVALARGRTPEWLRERLGAVADDAPLVAVSATGAELVTALRRNTALAVVAALPRTGSGNCTAATALASEVLASGWRITPLVETRDALVYRAGIGRVTVDADGSIRFGKVRVPSASSR